MSKSKANSGKTWTKTEVATIKKLAKGNTPTGLIAYELKRSESAVRTKASEEKIPLKPVNKSPYNRRKDK